MRFMLRAFTLASLLASLGYAQTIPPKQITPSQTSGQVLTTVTGGQPPSWQTPSTPASVTFEHNGSLTGINQSIFNLNDTTPAAPIGSTNVIWDPLSNGTWSGYVPITPFANSLQPAFVNPVVGQTVRIHATGAACGTVPAGTTCSTNGINSLFMWMPNTGSFGLTITGSINFTGALESVGLTPGQVTAVSLYSITSANFGFRAITCGGLGVVSNASGTWPFQQYTVVSSITGANVDTTTCMVSVYNNNNQVPNSMALSDFGMIVTYTGTPVVVPAPIQVFPPLSYAAGELGLQLPLDFNTDTGAVNASVIQDNSIQSLYPGLRERFLPNATNTTTTPTLQLYGFNFVQQIGATTIVKAGGAAVAVGDLVNNSSGCCIATVDWDGTHWELQNPQTGAGGGGSGTVTTFSSGNLAPLFTTSVSSPTVTPALSFALSNAAANTFFGNVTGSTGAPSYNSFPSCNGTTSALTYTNGTGLGCHTITPGTGTVTAVTGTSPITSTGGTTPAIGCATCDTGSGTTNYYPLFTGANTLGNGHLDDGVTTTGTITSTEPLAIAATSLATQETLTYNAGHAPAGTAGSAVVAPDTSGNLDVNENNTGFSRICTAANGQCTGSLSGTGTANYITKWTGTSAVGNSQTQDDGTHAVLSGNGYALTSTGGISFDAPNNATGGTAANKMACKSAAGTMATCGTAVVVGVQGVAIAGLGTAPGTTGNVSICFSGNCQVYTDNAATIGHYAIHSSTTAGDVHDSGATTPTAGVDNFLITATAAANALTTVQIGTPDWYASSTNPLSGMTATQVAIAGSATTVTSSKALAGSGAGITTGPTTSVNTDCVQFNGTTGQISDSGGPCASASLSQCMATVTQTLGSTSATITFSSIPQTCHTLVFEGQLLSTSGATDTVNMTLNGDTTTTDYSWLALPGYPTFTPVYSVATNGYAPICQIDYTTDSTFTKVGGYCDAQIDNYTGSTWNKGIKARSLRSNSGGATTGPYTWQMDANWVPATPAAITSVTFTINSAGGGGAFGIGSSITMSGR